jgi:hypothetical protein
MKSRNKNPDTGELIRIYDRNLKVVAVAESYDNGKVFSVRFVSREKPYGSTQYISRKELDKVIEAAKTD